TNTPKLTGQQFRRTAERFYSELAAEFRAADVPFRGGKTALSWEGGRVRLVDRSGEKCHPWRVYVYSFPGRLDTQHSIKIGAPGGRGLLDMLPALWAFGRGGLSDAEMELRYSPWRRHPGGYTAESLRESPARRARIPHPRPPCPPPRRAGAPPPPAASLPL